MTGGQKDLQGKPCNPDVTGWKQSTERIMSGTRGWAASACGRWGRSAGLCCTSRTRTCARTGTLCLPAALCTPRTALPPAHSPRHSPELPRLHSGSPSLRPACAAAALPAASVETSQWRALCIHKTSMAFMTQANTFQRFSSLALQDVPQAKVNPSGTAHVNIRRTS